ncbi:MAG: CRTAC1 family protein [Fuerstiella sp.]|nr:CRTAC1 family protein [Fuerstiella sp.]MCP4853753.1 CRTAC1 family protein [Fuerstiella sp.]
MKSQTRTRLIPILLFHLVLITASAGLAADPFQDVTDGIGLNGVGGGYAAWGDYNNDGWVDLTVDGQLWRNDNGKRFTRVKNVAFAGSGIWGDVDNDGDLDFFALGGKVYRNAEGESFKEIEQAIPEMPKSPMNATWADVNGDSFIDLYVTGYEDGGYHPDFLFRNKGDGTFEVIFRGPATPGRGVTACDYDEDGDIDIYVSNYRLVPNALLQNDGSGNLTDVAKYVKVDGDGDLGAWGHTIGSSWGDLDNDGHFDLFVGNFSHPPTYQDRPKFYRNLGKEKDWRFSDLSDDAGLHWQESYASPAIADFDNDGLLDLFFTTVYAGDRSVMYRNKGNWKFENVTADVKVDQPTTYQAAWADFDNDGYVDILNGGRLFKNPGGTNRWLKVRLSAGGKVNRTAFGSQVRVRLGEETLTRQVESATGQGNQNDLTLHFGLGAHDQDVQLEVRWPDGSKQALKDVKTNSIISVEKE